MIYGRIEYTEWTLTLKSIFLAYKRYQRTNGHSNMKKIQEILPKFLLQIFNEGRCPFEKSNLIILYRKMSSIENFQNDKYYNLSHMKTEKKSNVELESLLSCYASQKSIVC